MRACVLARVPVCLSFCLATALADLAADLAAPRALSLATTSATALTFLLSRSQGGKNLAATLEREVDRDGLHAE
eukprot:3553063-Pleurochrysis_carterae.AAC.1